MIKGHTYSGLDRSFNTMMMTLKRNAIYCISALMHYIWRSLNPYNCNHVYDLHALWDWHTYFEGGVLERFGGFASGQFGSGMHEFVSRKDSSGTVRLWMRKSSASTNWFPEGQGYEVWDKAPEGEPPLAKFVKRQDQWQRNEFEGALRHWFRFMVVESQEEKEKIKSEWSSYLAKLPSDDDVNAIDLTLRPKWGELPKFIPVQELAARASCLDGVSSMLENPPINPITGPGRTATEVQRELRGYQAWLRKTWDPSQGNFPVFQRDYLFIQLPSTPLFLARVTHDCCLDDATSPTLKFSVSEYVHVPQARVGGFFGTFTKKKNMAYNAKDKRTGGQYVKHSFITREHIVVYDVQTFVSRTMLAQNAADEKEPEDCLLVAASSLRKLAQARPELAMPSKLPQSHVEHDAKEREKEQASAVREREGDDPPPPIPEGFEQVEWSAGVEVLHFMIWTKLASVDKSNRWHQAVVKKTFKTTVRGNYTHDAAFALDKQVRGEHRQVECAHACLMLEG